MIARAGRRARLVGVVLALAGCTAKPCDEAKLARVADALDERSVAGRDAAVDALAGACPRLPDGLVMSLEGSFGSRSLFEVRAQRVQSRFDDRAYVAIHTRTCPAASSSAWREAVLADDRDAAMFEACGLQRYGLLADGEAFTFEDLDAYVLYEWLTGRGIDEALARRIARGLLSTHWSATELMDVCRREQSRCALALERRGISLPRSTQWYSDASFDGRTQLWVTADAVFVGDERVVELDPKQPPGSSPAHASPPVRAALAGANPRVLILADASLAFGTVADRWLDAVVAGGTEFELVLFDADGLEAIAVAPARGWFPPAARERMNEKPPTPPELWVSSDTVELRHDGRSSYAATRDCPGARCLDLDGLARALDELERSRRFIMVRIDPEVPYETVVALLVLVRNPGCKDDSVGIERRCWQGNSIIDQNPPLYWHTDSTLTLGDAEVDRSTGRDQSAPSTEDLLAAYEAKRAQLRACLLGDPPFLAGAGEAKQLALMWTPDVDGALVWTGNDDEPWASPELQACICRELGVESAVTRNHSKFILEWGVQLTIPLRFE